MSATAAPPRTKELDERQRTAWRSALALWGVQLREARQAPNAHEGSFAWFGFPPEVTVDPVAARRSGADTDWETVFAHEIGHHVLSPATRIASLAITQQLARCLQASSAMPVPHLRARAALLGNLWSDALINDRVVTLQRRRDPATEPGMIRLWRVLAPASAGDRLFWVVLRAYERLWRLAPGSLCSDDPPPRPPRTPANPDWRPDPRVSPTETEKLARDLEALVATDPAVDAELVADAVRSFAHDPVTGALSFGMVMAPYLLENDQPGKDPGSGAPSGLACAGDPHGAPATAAELGELLDDDRLRAAPRHPLAGDGVDPAAAPARGAGEQGYGCAETLALYADSDPQEVLTAWYLAEAHRWVRPLRRRDDRPPGVPDIPGPLETWELGDDLDEVDWEATVGAGSPVIPGVTTRRRSAIADEPEPAAAPVELDLYLDSSGSMPQPEQGSPAILAGTILALSVLQGGGRVRVTSWSGPGAVAGEETPTWRQQTAIAALLTYFGGGTAFPLDLLQRRYAGARSGDGVTRHLVVISDDGCASLFGEGQGDAQSDAGDGVAHAIRPVLTTATLVLLDPSHSMEHLAAEAGFRAVYLESIGDAPAACRDVAAELENARGAGRG